MFCTNCGNKNPDGVAFCMVCGKPTQWSTNAPQPTPAETQQPTNEYTPPTPPMPEPPKVEKPKKKKKRWVKPVVIISIILVVIISIVVGAFLALGANLTIKGTVKRIETAAKNGDATEALYAMMPKVGKYIIIEEYFDGDEEAFSDALEEADEIFENELDYYDIDVKSIKLRGDIEEADEDAEEYIKDEMSELYGMPVLEVKTGELRIRYKREGQLYVRDEEAYFYRTILGWTVYVPDWQNLLEDAFGGEYIYEG